MTYQRGFPFRDYLDLIWVRWDKQVSSAIRKKKKNRMGTGHWTSGKQVMLRTMYVGVLFFFIHGVYDP